MTPSAFHHGTSDHYMRLDFTGWRYVTVLLRERDARMFSDYVWPYGGYSTIYRTMVNPQHLGTFTAYLNDIPQGGKATVEVGEVRALTMVSNTLEGASVAVNGERFAVPFRMNAGEYAELDDGCWTHYSAMGDALARVAADAGVELLLAKPKYCGDNAAMIAGLAYYRRNVTDDVALAADVEPSLVVSC